MEYATRHLYFPYTRKYKWQVACSTVSHEKALHNYFIPCLNLRKTYGNFGKSSEISANFRKLRKRFKPVFEERLRNDLWNFWKTSETVQKCFPNVFMIFKIFGKSSEIFGSVRKFSENFGNGSKVIFRCFYDFLKFSENLRKSFEVFGNLRKFSENFGNGSKVIFRCFYDFLIFSENLRKCSEIFGNDFRMWLEMFVTVRRSWKVSELAFEKSSNGPQ